MKSAKGNRRKHAVCCWVVVCIALQFICSVVLLVLFIRWFVFVVLRIHMHRTPSRYIFLGPGMYPLAFSFRLLRHPLSFLLYASIGVPPAPGRGQHARGGNGGLDRGPHDGSLLHRDRVGREHQLLLVQLRCVLHTSIYPSSV